MQIEFRSGARDPAIPRALCALEADARHATVYRADGRRAVARVRCAPGTVDWNLGEPVWCEAALGGVECDCEGAPELDAALRLAVGEWRAVDDGGECDIALRPLDCAEAWLARGIYALAAPARECPARATRMAWDGLMRRWQAAGLRAYAVERGGRAVGYMLLGAPGGPEPAPGCAALFEYAALPCEGVELSAALAAACARGICAPRGVVLGSALAWR